MNSLDYWRNQAAKASERERKALEQAADYQRRLSLVSAEFEALRKKIMNLLN